MAIAVMGQIREKSSGDPLSLPFVPLPLEGGSLKSSYGVWGAL